MFDLAILEAKIVDGSGAPCFMGDLGIHNRKIIQIGRIEKSEYIRTVNASGRVISPGFIDIHSHYDFVIFRDPILLSVIHQGVTTVISGQCGDSRAPLRDDMIEDFIKFSAAGSGGAEIPYNWRSFSEFLSIVDKMRIGVNLGSLVGHSTIRRCVMGVENRIPKKAELEEMKQLLDESLQEGALGFSTGLVYAPGMYAETPELIELAKVLRKYNLPYMTHLRSEGSHFIEAVKEALAIAKEAHVPCHLAHHKAMGKSNWHKVKLSLRLVEEARATGLDVTVDLYPYVLATSMLRSILPSWVQEGGIEAMVQRLNSPEERTRIIKEIETSSGSATLWNDAGGPEGVIVMDTMLTHQYEGKNLVEASALSGKSPLETALDILALNKGWDTACYQVGSEENIKSIITKPYSMIGSDAVPCAPNAKGNPRTNGTFPRVLSKYCREEGVLTLEESVAKMTSFPARRLNLSNKGLINYGMDADLVLFDESCVRDMADLVNPDATPVGIDWVFIGGIPVLEEGIFTEQRVGRALYRK